MMIRLKIWNYFNANPVAFERGNKGRLMLTRKSNASMTRYAVGLHIFWRDSP